jgi:hypothetical protein
MPFNIQTFSSNLNSRYGVLRNNKYRVTITNPGAAPAGLFPSGVPSESISHFAQGAMIPGYQLLTHDYRRYTYGTNEARPFAPNFVALQLIYGADGQMVTWQFFESWMQHIMPHDVATYGTGVNSGFAAAGTEQFPYFLKYKSQYATDIELRIYGEDGWVVKIIKFRQAFPINLNPIKLSYDEQNNYAQFTVILDYLDWYEESTGPANQTTTGAASQESTFTPPPPTPFPG